MDNNSLSRSNSDISDETFPFSFFYETSDKYANFIMRNGLGASNVIGENIIMKSPGEIASLLHATNVEIDLVENVNYIPVSLTKSTNDLCLTAGNCIFGTVLCI